MTWLIALAAAYYILVYVGIPLFAIWTVVRVVKWSWDHGDDPDIDERGNRWD